MLIFRNLKRAHACVSDYKWPQIKGLSDFQGKLIHTANWPEGYDYRGKTVAVLGNGATGVQIVPAIQSGGSKCP